MIIEGCDPDVGSGSNSGNKAIGEADGDPLAAQIIGKTPGDGPSLRRVNKEVKCLGEVKQDRQFFFRFRSLHQFSKNNSCSADVIGINPL
jgi:hypothetical protein